MIKLSILIPTYNFKRGLLDILEGLIKCDPKELKMIEVIIGDDSTKEIISQKELEYFRKYIHNLFYIKNSRKGFVENWNNLIDRSNGQYFWLLHHNEVLFDTKNSLSHILNTLDKNFSLFIIPITKIYSIKIFKEFRFNLLMNHTINHGFLSLFLRNRSNILSLNLIGPPSALIIDNHIKIKYRNELKWLVDVEYYYRLLGFIKPEEIKIYSRKRLFILSNQNFDNSLTKSLKRDNQFFKKLKKYEFKNISKINYPFLNYIFNFILWFLFKLNCLISIRLKKVTKN